MPPEGVLSISIRADFWQPQKNEGKAELIKYWHQRAVLDRMNIQILKQLHTTMSRPFYRDAKKAKNVLGCHLSVNQISYSSNQGGS